MKILINGKPRWCWNKDHCHCTDECVALVKAMGDIFEEEGMQQYAYRCKAGGFQIGLSFKEPIPEYDKDGRIVTGEVE